MSDAGSFSALLFCLTGPRAFLTAGECGASGRMIWCGIVPVYNGTYFSGRGLLAPSCALRLSSDGFLAGVWPACRRLSRAAWLCEWRNGSCQPDANKETGQICLSLAAALQTHKHTHRNTGHVESWETSRAAVLVNTLLAVYIEWDELIIESE